MLKTENQLSFTCDNKNRN